MRKIYLWTDALVNQWDRAKYTYRAASATGTLSPVMSGEVQEANQTAAILEALLASLKEFSGKQRQPVCVVCACNPVILAINQRLLEKWETNGYINAKGNAVAHANLWKEVRRLSKEKQIDLSARAPDNTETAIMYELGAGYFLPHTNLAQPV